MGEVYRAHDSRLDREVAIKVLPAELLSDEDRLRRFEQEAKATSALNHPNILTVYDIGEHEGSPFIVAELLDGEELRFRLDEGPIPLRKVTEYAQQIVSGLSAAHEKGIVHRDLKPENLFITKDDRVKILDFGLAKLREPSTNIHGSEDATRRALTNPGVVMGTAGYMSPEQVRGQTVDQRSDIFSFGVILYEMLTGGKAFHGDSMVELMNAILKEDVPEFEDDNRRVPPAFDKIMRRCLEKKPEHRFYSAHDLGFAIEALSMASSSGVNRTEAVQALDTAATAKLKGSRVRGWMIAVGLFAVLALGLGGGMWAPWRSSPRNPALRLTPFSFEQGGQTEPVWSPDGKAVAFAARQKITDPYQVYVRYLDSPVPTQITHLAESAEPINWTSAGKIVFYSSQAPEGLWSVSPVGGEPEPVVPLDPERARIYRPRTASVSRDGAAAALLHQGDDGNFSIWISSPPGAALKPYEPAPFASRTVFGQPVVKFSPDGKQILLIWNPTGSGDEAWLMPYPADPAKPPHRVFQGLPVFGSTPTFSWMPDNRHAVLSTTPDGAPDQLYMADTVSGAFAVFSSGTTAEKSPAVSPDGSKLVFLEAATDYDVVSVDLATAAVSPLIFTQRNELMPAWASKEPALVYVTDRNGDLEIWLHKPGQPDRPLVTARDFPPDTTRWFMGPSLSPDATRVIYTRIERHGPAQLWMSAVAGGAPVRLVNAGADSKHGASWSPDGNWFVYWEFNQAGGFSLNKVKTTGQAEPEVLKASVDRSEEWLPVWSPSGEWILHSDGGVKLISPDGKTTRDLSSKSAVARAFSADGRTIYGIRQVAADRLELFSMSVAAGTEKTIGPLGEEYLPASFLRPALRLSLTPDGRSLTYGTARYTSNLWLMEGLDTVAPPR